MKETMVGVQVELVGGHQYPIGSSYPVKYLRWTTKSSCQLSTFAHFSELFFDFTFKKACSPTLKSLDVFLLSITLFLSWDALKFHFLHMNYAY